MAIRIPIINQPQEFDFESATLGRLCCRTLSVKAYLALEELLTDDSLTGRSLVVNLMEHVARHVREADEDDTASKQKRTPITAEEANQLTDEEIEAFASQFLVHNPSLLQTYEGATKSTRTNEKGERPFAGTLRGQDIQKESGESDSDYLARVLRHYVDEQSRRLKEIAKPLAGLFKSFSLSDATQDILRENLVLSDRLRRLASGLDTSLAQAIGTPTLPDIPVPRHDITIPPNPIHETNVRLNNVLDRMDDMRPLVVESVNLVRSMNDASIRMLGDFGDNARRTEIYTRVIIAIAAVGLVVTAVFSVLNHFSSKTGAEHLDQLMNRFNTQMYLISEAQDLRANRMVTRFTDQVQTLTGVQDRRTERLIAEFQVLLSKQAVDDRNAYVEALTKAIKSLNNSSPAGGKPPDSDKPN